MLLNLIILLLGLSLIAGVVYTFSRYQVRRQIRERVLYGFHTEEEEGEFADLSAGDYGLTGQMKFYYNLRLFLGTSSGKASLFIIGATVIGLSAYFAGKPVNTIMYMAPGGGAGVVLLGLMALVVRKREQENMVRSELPNALQTLSAIMEGGIAFETALGHVIKEADPRHPLYFELGIMSEAMQRGRRRNEAMRLWANRSDVPAVTELVSGLIQADQTGASLGQVLKHHGEALMRENETIIQRRAERLPIRMLMPMASMILPAVMIVAAGPSMVRIFQIMRDIMGKA